MAFMRPVSPFQAVLLCQNAVITRTVCFLQMSPKESANKRRAHEQQLFSDAPEEQMIGAFKEPSDNPLTWPAYEDQAHQTSKPQVGPAQAACTSRLAQHAEMIWDLHLL